MKKPCLNCRRVDDPLACDNKCCKVWQKWFCESWDRLRRQPRLSREAKPVRAGTDIGGVRYALPHQVDDYLDRDPCEGCLCPRDLCGIPCRVKRDWLRTKELIQ